MAKFFNNVWFKCISFLLILCIILGALLSVLNTVLYVSPEERTERAIKKIYGTTKEYSVIYEGEKIECDNFGSIDKIYFVEGENDNVFDYLFHVTGEHGFQDGSITYWAKVTSNSGKLSISNLLIESNKKQSFIGSITDDWHKNIEAENIDDNSKYYTPWESVSAGNEDYLLIPTSGATNSKNASCNAVNCIIYYINNFELGGANEN